MKVKPPTISWVVAAGAPLANSAPAPAGRKSKPDRLALSGFEQMVRRLMAEQPAREQVDPGRLEAARQLLDGGELDRHLEDVAAAMLEESKCLQSLLE